MSIDRESELSLAADAPAASRFLTARGGRLHEPSAADPGAWWVEMHPASEPADETYYGRLGWSVYPGAPPSVKFAHTIGGPLGDPRAWPVVPGYRPSQLDVCMPFTAEGFALHPDWANSSQAWRPDGNPFLAVARELQRGLNSPRYEGRFKG